MNSGANRLIAVGFALVIILQIASVLYMRKKINDSVDIMISVSNSMEERIQTNTDRNCQRQHVEK